MGYQLKVVKGKFTGKAFEVTADELTIGRVESNILVVFDSGVSRQHAVLRKEGGGYRIADLGSRNGTLLNGAPIVEEALGDGDLITVGNVSLRFSGGGGGRDRLSDEHTQILGMGGGKGKRVEDESTQVLQSGGGRR
ncbi:MAG: FHA domain-containing protein [Deltaproteobacteria bacterium]|nr:FHA domain-containing protein [Deltaproteobacteria bacterium]